MAIKKYAGDKIVGLSSDAKPNNIPDGATFYETDTLKSYIKTGANTWNWIANTTFSENITTSGNVGIGTTLPTTKLDANTDIIRIRNSKTPASNTAEGNQGDICWDADYIYVCTAANNWVRSALSSW